jgi:hypothetical protein
MKNFMLNTLTSVLIVVGITLLTQNYHTIGFLLFIGGIYVIDSNNTGVY